MLTFRTKCDIIITDSDYGGGTLRNYLKKIRKESGLTQEQAALKFGIGASSYTMIENGERQKDISLSLAKKISDVFDVPLSTVIEEEAKIREG